jgi:hypothetical protein
VSSGSGAISTPFTSPSPTRDCGDHEKGKAGHGHSGGKHVASCQ